MPESLLDFAAQVSRSQGAPFFLYSADVFRKNLRALSESWRSPLYLSVKANPNPAILEVAAEICTGFDISSEREARLVLRVKKDLSACTVSGPAKGNSFLALRELAEVQALHLDSAEEAAATIAWGTRRTLRIALGPSARPKLGFTVEEASALLSQGNGRAYGGFHAYLGRDSFSSQQADAYFGIGEKIAAEFPDRFIGDWSFYLGPGLPAEGASLASVMPRRPLSLEVGRAALAEAGVYCAQVLSVKKGKDRAAVIVDGGLQHFTGWPSPRHGYQSCRVVALRNGLLLPGQSRAAIYGSLCLGNDILHPDSLVPEGLQRDDWICISGAGAYGVTASASDFIGQRRPREWLLDGGRVREISPVGLVGYHEAF